MTTSIRLHTTIFGYLHYSGRILELAATLGVDAIVVACPLCQMNLDLRQKQAGRAGETSYNIPVLYFTQLLGLAFDLPRKEPSKIGRASCRERV